MTKYKSDKERKAAKVEYNRKYRETPIGRASYLLDDYRKMDRHNGFGNCIDFDAKWIVENIFTQKCAHCDCTDWRELGCNRIDNDLPHTKSNVESCCKLHNNELGLEEFGLSPIPVAQFDKVTGELIAVWKNACEVERQLGYSQGNIWSCCNGRYKQAYGSVWRKLTIEEYETLRACIG